MLESFQIPQVIWARFTQFSQDQNQADFSFYAPHLWNKLPVFLCLLELFAHLIKVFKHELFTEAIQ